MEQETFCLFETEWGCMGVVRGANGCKRIVLPSNPRLVADEIRSNHPGSVEDSSPRQELAALFDGYFQGKCGALSLDLDWSDHPGFFVMVWSAAQFIEPGEVRTYKQLSSAIGRPAACRAVGTALGRNPFPLAVPCHRVVRVDGGLGGFSAPLGVALKRRLLEREGIMFDERGRVRNVHRSPAKTLIVNR